jgi:hypothetical protein
MLTRAFGDRSQKDDEITSIKSHWVLPLVYGHIDQASQYSNESSAIVWLIEKRQSSPYLVELFISLSSLEGPVTSRGPGI